MAGRSMGRNASSVGMMEGAFFVSRGDLIQWVNNLLQLNIAKVEQCANGAIYCQIIDSCHPGSVAMKKVNWTAKSDHEFIPNYKVLQAAFDRNGIERHIDVDKLIRAKYQDNLEFMQWMKCYWDREGQGRCDYDPAVAREGKPVPPWARALGASNGGGPPYPPVAGGPPVPSAGGRQAGEKENLRPRPPSAQAEIVKKTASASQRAAPQAAHRAAPAKSPSRQDELEKQVVSQQEELVEVRAYVEMIERERDYYFRKLRDVEVLCETLKAQMPAELTSDRIISDVQGILYAEEAAEAGLDAEHIDD